MKLIHYAALGVLLLALCLLAFAHWLPALGFFPIGLGMFLWNGEFYSNNSADKNIHR